MATSKDIGYTLSSKKSVHSPDCMELSERCINHNEQALTYYCVSCDSELCAACYSELHGKSMGCDVIQIANAIEELQSRKKHVNESVKTLQQLCTRLKTVLKEKEQLAKVNKLDIRSVVTKAQADLQERIKMCSSSLCYDLKDLGLVNQTHLDSGKELITDISCGIENFQRYSEDEKLAQIRRMYRSRQKVAKMHQTIERMQTTYLEKITSIRYKTVPYDGTFADLRSYSLVGGVMVYSNQLVHVFDERKMFGWVRVSGIDHQNPYKEHWRHIFTIDDDSCPVVMSHVKMTYQNKLYRAVASLLLPHEKKLYQGEDHVLFAVGAKVFIVSTNRSALIFECYEAFASLVIDDMNPGSFITSITASCQDLQADDRFLISVNDSKCLREYRVSGEVIRTIDTRNVFSPIQCIAYVENDIAIIDSSNKDVVLVTDGNEVRQNGFIKMPSGHLPICLIWTGATWLVLNVKEGNENRWRVADYEKNGQLIEVLEEGTSKSSSVIPISITRRGSFAYITFADNTVKEFQKKGYL